jgi:peptide deformylase
MHVTLKGRDRGGREIRVKATGLLAQALQHESDHLDGVLFFDHLPSMDQLRRTRPAEETVEV